MEENQPWITVSDQTSHSHEQFFDKGKQSTVYVNVKNAQWKITIELTNEGKNNRVDLSQYEWDSTLLYHVDSRKV